MMLNKYLLVLLDYKMHIKAQSSFIAIKSLVKLFENCKLAPASPSLASAKEGF